MAILAIEDLTTEQQATFRAEIGVTTPLILELLEGETLPIDGISLGEQGAIVQEEAGALIRNGNTLAWSDAVNPGGSIIHDDSRITGWLKLLAASYASNSRTVLATITIPARFAEVDSILSVIFSYDVFGNSANLPSGTSIGFVTDNRKLLSGNTIGSIFGWQLQEQINQQAMMMAFEIKLSLDTDTTKIYLNTNNKNAVRRPLAYGTSGNVTVINAPITPEDLSFDAERSTALIGEAFNLYLVIDIPASATPSTAIEVAFDVQVRGKV